MRLVSTALLARPAAPAPPFCGPSSATLSARTPPAETRSGGSGRPPRDGGRALIWPGRHLPAVRWSGTGLSVHRGRL